MVYPLDIVAFLLTNNDGDKDRTRHNSTTEYLTEHLLVHTRLPQLLIENVFVDISLVCKRFLWPCEILPFPPSIRPTSYMRKKRSHIQ